MAQTIQATGKAWKAAQAVGLILAIVGFVAVFSGASPTTMLVGIALFLGARFGSWWMHGAIVLLLANPAHALVLCTMPDGKKYAGDFAPEGCEVERQIERAEPVAVKPAPVAGQPIIVVPPVVVQQPAAGAPPDVDPSLEHFSPAERARILRNRKIDQQVEVKNQLDYERSHEIDQEVIRHNAKVRAAREATRGGRRGIVVVK